jgi:hypothetical protein
MTEGRLLGNSLRIMGVSTKTIHGTLHKEKLARWLPKLTDKEIIKERARTCKTFVGAVPSYCSLEIVFFCGIADYT